MAKIFRASEREFRENAGRVDGYRLSSDAKMSDFGGGNGGGAACGQDANARLKFDVRRLGAGQKSSLYHFHRAAEELFMIVSGAATLRTPDGRQVLSAGDLAYFERGERGAHQLENHTSEDCVYLDIRTFDGLDVADYPDTNSLLIIPATAEQVQSLFR